MSVHQEDRNMNEGLPGCSQEFVYARFHLLPEQRRGDALALLEEVGRDDYWEKSRYVQVVRLLDHKDDYRVRQTDIAKLLDLSDNIVSRYKRYHRQHPEEERRQSGRRSEIRDVFKRLENFIDEKNRAHQAVTMDILLEFAINQLHIVTSRKLLRRYVKEHGFAYKLASTRDRVRVITRESKIERFYNKLVDDLNGIDPSLVFNVDEMGVELFADRKDVMVFIRHGDVPRNGNLIVGVERSSRRCTLIACISLDGDTLKPTILTKTKTINSFLFERGYSPDTVKIMSTENSFVTAAVFEIWLNDVFLPAVDKKRRTLRRRFGDVDDRAVLILDGCSSHLKDRFRQVLEEHRVTMRFLVPHTSHLTQPLDVGIFGWVKYLIRSNASYTVNIRNIDSAAADEEAAEREHREPSAERGKKLAEFILTILQAYHQATTPPRVVSAFEQVGICSRFANDVDLDRRVAFVDPTRARLVMDETNLFRQTVPIEDQRHRQLRIADLNLESQREMAPQERQHPGLGAQPSTNG